MDEQKNQPDVEQGKIPSPSQICTPTSSSLGGTKDDEPSEKEEETQTLVLTGVLALVLAITPIIAIPLLPLMLAFYLIAHIVQVFRTDEDNEVGMVMRDIAKWLSILCGLISVDLLLCMLIFGVTPSLKHLEFEGVSITRWIGALAIICVFFTYSTVVRLVLSYRGRKRRGASHLYEGIIGSINSAFYLLALLSVTRVVPILKHHKILSLSAQKWIRMILLVILGHHAVCIVTSSIILSLRSKYIESGKEQFRKSKGKLSRITYTVVYYAEGLRRSFNFVLTSLLVLLTWTLYFGSRLNRSLSEIRKVYDFVFWTSFCILVTAFLWLVKNGVVLSWEARVVYNPFKKMISGTANQLYLIGKIAGPKFDVLGFWKKVESDNEADDQGRQQVFQRDEQGNETSLESNGEEGSGKENQQPTNQGTSHEDRDRDDSETYIRDYRPQWRAQWRASQILVREEDSKDWPYTSDIARIARYFMAAEGPLSKDGYVSDFVAQWRRANHHLSNYCDKSERTNRVPVHNLHGSELDKVDVALLFKQLDKDKYKITDSEKWIVEVKRIGVWKTIFSKVGTTDEVVYPNTVLATTSIVNHKGEADPNDYVDYVELRLNSTTKKEQILQLKGKILEHLDHNEDGFRKHPPGVLVKDIGETVTIAVHFKHDVAKIGAMTSTDRIQKKSKSRQEFLLQIKAFLDEIDNKEGTNTHTSSSPITKGKKQMGIEDRQKTV